MEIAGRLTELYPTISIRELECRPKSGPAVTGTGEDNFSLLLFIIAPVKVGNADLFCLASPGTDVSTRNGNLRLDVLKL